MAKLKLGPIVEDKPVKVTLELPASLHRDLVAYAAILGREAGNASADPIRLIVPMLERFMASDRGFAKAGAMANTKPVLDRLGLRVRNLHTHFGHWPSPCSILVSLEAKALLIGVSLVGEQEIERGLFNRAGH